MRRAPGALARLAGILVLAGRLGVPRTGAEIETLMRTDGILQVLRDRGLVLGE